MAEQEPSSRRWEVYPAFDLAFGEAFRTDPYLQGKILGIDIGKVQDMLDVLDPDSSGAVEFIISSSQRITELRKRGDNSYPTLLILNPKTIGLARTKRNPKTGAIDRASAYVSADEILGLTPYKPVDEIAVHELTHIIDLHNPGLAGRAEKIRKILDWAPAVGSVVFGLLGLSLGLKYGPENRQLVAMGLGHVLGGVMVDMAINMPFRTSSGTKNIRTLYFPLERRARRAEDKYRGHFPEFIRIEELSETTSA